MNVRVFLIDDHEEARTTLARRLSRDERVDLVGAASSVEEAAALLPDARPDLVLLDIHGQNGLHVEACRRLRRLTGARVVIFTSFLTGELWTAAKEAGASDYLLKQIDTARLSRELVRLAERHSARTG